MRDNPLAAPASSAASGLARVVLTERAVLDRINGAGFVDAKGRSQFDWALNDSGAIAVRVVGRAPRAVIAANETGGYTVTTGKSGWPLDWSTLADAVEAARTRLRVQLGTRVNRCGCWLAPPSAGSSYSQLQHPPKLPAVGKWPKLHVVSWVVFRGPRDLELTLDHVCQTTLCAHPDHLDQVSREENWRRTALPFPGDQPGWLAEARRLIAESAAASGQLG
jgi:hypothetical protein